MRPKVAEPFLALLLFALFLMAPGAAAQGGPDDTVEGALFLLLPVGARGVSLGRAMTWVEGAEGAFWNPAGLAGVDRGQAVFIVGDHVVSTATAVSVLWANPSVGTVGASYVLFDAGDIDRTDEFGNYIGSITLRNHVGILSAATRLTDGLSAGVNFKVIRFQLACRGICPDEGTTATTYAVDAGLQGRPTERLRIGAMVAHLGPSLQAENAAQADPLPARIRVAVAYDLVAVFTDAEDLRGWLAVEFEDRLKALGSMSVYVGTELTAGQGDELSLRAGYVWSELAQEDGGRVGLGLRYERFDLSIAKSLAISVITGKTEPIHVSFSIAF